jgi:hypothetical protein
MAGDLMDLGSKCVYSVILMKVKVFLVPWHPVKVLNRVIAKTEYPAHFIKEFGLRVSRRGRHRILPWRYLKNTGNKHRAILPENPANIILSR